MNFKMLQSFAPVGVRYDETALNTMCWSLEVESVVLILACRWKESFRQQLLWMNGTQVSHHLSSVLYTPLKLTTRLS